MGKHLLIEIQSCQTMKVPCKKKSRDTRELFFRFFFLFFPHTSDTVSKIQRAVITHSFASLVNLRLNVH